MTETDREWDARIRHAPTSDSRSRCGDSWVPPVEELLWRTARASTLARFFPFSSHNSLRLATSPDIFATAAYLDPCIVYCYDDFEAPDRRPEYWVRDVWPQDLSREPVLRTYDVEAAVRELERLTAHVTPAA
ncbi:hypothetical protein [Streptomyces virginiae]|uniref:hypothetical protein n=1 Tax=Streptomyces virginiae TaxID=1961 RepID=UPI000525296D|nr:hypothetical protein [Streptomyces virginiae]